MPAKKSADLVVRHETKAERQKRDDQADALIPDKSLTTWPPNLLTGDVARSTWRATTRLYLTLDARIASTLDKGLLIDYCNVSDQLAQIDNMRADAKNNYDVIKKILQMLLEGEKDDIDLKALNNLANTVNESYEAFLKLDARADGKRKLLHSYRQSLLLTPRSRGGVSPDEKPKEQEQSEMDRIIDGDAPVTKGKKHVR
jgi:hypothetical protein